MKRKLIFLLLFLCGSPLAFAEDTAAQTNFWSDPLSHPLMPLYTVSVFVLIVVLLVSLVALYIVRILNMLTRQAEQERAAKLGITYTRKPSWWSRFSQAMNASVPLEQENEIELDHNYDGIKELDNHLPPWWKWLFVTTIAWGAVYLVVFHLADTLPLSIGEYQNEVALAEQRTLERKAREPEAEVDENALAFSLDSIALIEKGKKVFTDNNCGSCHRNDGGGNTIGPNLTDAYWLHGGHIKNVFGTIKNGVVEKGMPAWGKALSPQQVRDVTYFVLSLQGTNPANPKAAQGDLYQEVVKSDSTSAQASL